MECQDGIQWHDVPCYFRSRIICEDSDLQMERVGGYIALRCTTEYSVGQVKAEHGVDVSIPLSAPAAPTQ